MAKKILGLIYPNKIFNFIKSHLKLSIVILIGLIILGYFLYPKNNVIIATEKVQKGDLIQSVSITGSIESQSVANLSFQSQETLSYVGVKLGDVVKIGQEIAALDPSKLQATVRQTQQDFIAAKAASEKYYDNHNDTESLQEKVTRTAIDDAQNKAYDQYLKAQYDLNHSVLYSPIVGVVTRMDAQAAGVNVTPATVFTIVDPNSLDFKMDVDEADIGKIKVGQEVRINLDSYPNENLTFKVDSIDFVTHTTSTGGNAFSVKAKINNLNNNYKFRVGMNGNADIILNKVANVLYVPVSSIFDNDKVYVKIGNKYKKTTVELGLQNDINTEIKNGLLGNEDIVSDPTQVKPSQVL